MLPQLHRTWFGLRHHWSQHGTKKILVIRTLDYVAAPISFLTNHQASIKDPATPFPGSIRAMITNETRQYSIFRPLHSISSSHHDSLFTNGFLDDLTIKEFTDSVYIRTNEYIDDDFTEDRLAEAFVEDFSRVFSHCRSLAKDVSRAFWNLLTKRALYIKNGCGIPMVEGMAGFIHVGFENRNTDVPRPQHNPNFCLNERLGFNRPIKVGQPGKYETSSKTGRTSNTCLVDTYGQVKIRARWLDYDESAVNIYWIFLPWHWFVMW